MSTVRYDNAECTLTIKNINEQIRSLNKIRHN